MTYTFQNFNIFDKKSCFFPQCGSCNGVYVIFLIIITLIFFYWVLLILQYGIDGAISHDFMNKKVFDLPQLENCCSLWPISHFILFFILGLLFPDCGVLIISLGIGWEFFEAFMSTLFDREKQPIRINTGAEVKVEYSKNWWAGSMKDVVMDISGFMLGWFVAKKMGIKLGL